MRFHRALHQIVMRFSGLEETEGMELYAEAQTNYKEVLDAAKAKNARNVLTRAENDRGRGRPGFKEVGEVALTREEKFILFAEKYQTRYGIAIVYILLVPKIKEYYEGSSEEEDEFGQMDPMEFMQAYSMMQKMNSFKKK